MTINVVSHYTTSAPSKTIHSGKVKRIVQPHGVREQLHQVKESLSPPPSVHILTLKLIEVPCFVVSEIEIVAIIDFFLADALPIRFRHLSVPRANECVTWFDLSEKFMLGQVITRMHTDFRSQRDRDRDSGRINLFRLMQCR